MTFRIKREDFLKEMESCNSAKDVVMMAHKQTETVESQLIYALWCGLNKIDISEHSPAHGYIYTAPKWLVRAFSKIRRKAFRKNGYGIMRDDFLSGGKK